MKHIILLLVTLLLVAKASAQMSEQDEAKGILVKSLKEDVRNNKSILQSSGSLEVDYERARNLKVSKTSEPKRISRSSSSSGTATRRNATRLPNSSNVGAPRVTVRRRGSMSNEARAARYEAAAARRRAESVAVAHDADMRHEFMGTVTADNLRKIAAYSDPDNRPTLSAEDIKQQKRGYSGNYIEKGNERMRGTVDIRAGVDNKRSGEELWQIHRSSGKLTKEEEGRLSEWLKRQDVEY